MAAATEGPRAWFSGNRGPSCHRGAGQRSCGSCAPRDAPVLDVKDVAGGAELGEACGIGAGEPDLRAELCKLVEQRSAPARIEMGDHLVKQEQRDDAGGDRK